MVTIYHYLLSFSKIFLKPYVMNCVKIVHYNSWNSWKK